MTEQQFLSKSRQQVLLRRFAGAVTIIAGLFSFAVGLLMLANYIQLSRNPVIDHPALDQLRSEYSGTQSDQRLAESIRELDTMVRSAYFARRWQQQTGAWLLAIGSCIFLVSLRVWHRFRPVGRLPFSLQPDIDRMRARRGAGLPADTPSRTNGPMLPNRSPSGSRAAINALLAVGVIMIGAAIFFGTMVGDLPRVPAGGDGSTPTAAIVPQVIGPWPDQAYRDSWPAFRGPFGIGVAGDREPPTSWNIETGLNVVWRSSVPTPGFSSPVVWYNHVYLTGATADDKHVYCYDADTGGLLWDHRLAAMAGSPPQAPRVDRSTGYAAPTAATGNEGVFAIFATGELVAVSHEGELLWAHSFGVPDNVYGHSSSLLLANERLYVQLDQAADSYLICLSAADGNEIWRVARDTFTSWASPVITPYANGYQIVLNATPYAASYDAETGEELWSVTGIMGEVASSAAYADGVVLIVNQIASIIAVADGDIRWEAWDELPDASSPVAANGLVWSATGYGVITCYSLDDGEIVWKQEVGDGFYSSPIVAGEHVYFLDRGGMMYVLEAADRYALVSASPMGAPSDATPAFVGNRIYARTEEEILCIGSTDG